MPITIHVKRILFGCGGGGGGKVLGKKGSTNCPWTARKYRKTEIQPVGD